MAIYTIPQQNIVVPSSKVTPTFTTVDHTNGTVSTQLNVLDANNNLANRISVSYPISELGVTVVALETSQGNSTIIVNAIKAALQKI